MIHRSTGSIRRLPAWYSDTAVHSPMKRAPFHIVDGIGGESCQKERASISTTRDDYGYAPIPTDGGIKHHFRRTGLVHRRWFPPVAAPFAKAALLERVRGSSRLLFFFVPDCCLSFFLSFFLSFHLRSEVARRSVSTTQHDGKNKQELEEVRAPGRCALKGGEAALQAK